MRKFLFRVSALILAISLVTPLLARGDEGVLDRVKNRGRLICGVHGSLPGFGFLNENGEWSGFDVDYGRAIAAAVLGDPSKVEFVPLKAPERFPALQTGEIDVLIRNTTWTLTRDTQVGADFAPPTFYDGQGFLLPKDLGVTSLKELAGASIGVTAGSTTELNLADTMRALGVDYNPVVFEEIDTLYNSYEQGRCDVVTSDKSQLVARRQSLKDPEAHIILDATISKEPLGPVTVHGDNKWNDIAEGLLDLHVSLSDDAETLQAQHTAYLAEVRERMAAWRVEAEPRYASEERPIHMARLVRELQGVMPDDGILVVDGGFAAHWTGLLYDSTRAGRSYIANRGFASIGYGLPGTIGAQLAAPDSPVVGLTGDAGFNMMLGELETARRLGLGFTLAIVNNAASGYVKALQHSLYGGRYQSSDLSETHYANVARELGCHGIRVSEPSKLGAAFAEGIAARDIPTIIDVIVTRDPAKMLPGVDSRTAPVQKGDRPA